jgi:hypothetical protein
MLRTAAVARNIDLPRICRVSTDTVVLTFDLHLAPPREITESTMSEAYAGAADGVVGVSSEVKVQLWPDEAPSESPDTGAGIGYQHRTG